MKAVFLEDKEIEKKKFKQYLKLIKDAKRRKNTKNVEGKAKIASIFGKNPVRGGKPARERVKGKMKISAKERFIFKGCAID